MVADGADVNAKNTGGQTPIIVAIVMGQYQLVDLLLSERADPFLQDNTGLDAIQWARRKGRTDLADSLANYSRLHITEPDLMRQPPEPPPEPIEQREPLSADEKSRRFIAGLKQRIDERAVLDVADVPFTPIETEAPLPPAETYTVPITTTKTQPKEDSLRKTSLRGEENGPRTSSRKKCPRCGTTYDNELLAYCVYDEVALVDADVLTATPRPQVDSPPSSTLVWVLVAAALVLGALVGLYVINRVFETPATHNPSVAGPPPAPSQKGKPQLEEQLEGKADLLPEAEVPANTVKEPTTITVRVRVDRDGKVSEASSVRGDQVLRDAAVDAAKKAKFSVKKLNGRPAEGTITYTFR